MHATTTHRGLESSDAASNAALIERVQTLRAILPGMAEEVAIARREAARLRRENAQLQRRVGELEAHGSPDDEETTVA